MLCSCSKVSCVHPLEAIVIMSFASKDAMSTNVKKKIKHNLIILCSTRGVEVCNLVDLFEHSVQTASRASRCWLSGSPWWSWWQGRSRCGDCGVRSLPWCGGGPQPCQPWRNWWAALSLLSLSSTKHGISCQSFETLHLWEELLGSAASWGNILMTNNCNILMTTVCRYSRPITTARLVVSTLTWGRNSGGYLLPSWPALLDQSTPPPGPAPTSHTVNSSVVTGTVSHLTRTTRVCS